MQINNHIRTNISRVLLIAILIIAGIGLSTMQTHAATEGKATGSVNASVGAWLRQGASTNSKQIKLLADNTKLTIDKEVFVTRKSSKVTNRWYHVTDATNKSGYIRADLVDNIEYNSFNVQTKCRLNYRAGAGKKMKLKGTFNKKKKVTAVLPAKAVGDSTTWYKVKKGTGYVYVSGKYVKKVKTTTTKTTAASAAAVKITTTPEFTIKDLTYPVTLYTGVPFGLSGTVTSTLPIEKVEIGVVNSAGKWEASEIANPNARTFNIATIDAHIKFGSLAVGNYTYRGDFYVNGKCYTKFTYKFVVKKATGGIKITNKAFELAWPIGTSTSTYKFKGGGATAAFTKAFDKVYPTHSKWGVGPRTGACCDVFVGTVIRASGYDPDMERGETEMWSYFPKSPKWAKVEFTGNETQLQSGDVILYKRTDGGQHVCLYVQKNGKGYLAEAAYQKYYGHINTSISKILKFSNKTKVEVYRATS